MVNNKVAITAYDNKTGEQLRIYDDEKYRLCISWEGILYLCSLTEKDEDGYDKELDVRFEIDVMC